MQTVPPGEPNDAKLDPVFPTAYPIEGKAGLMGDMPVRICAEGGELVAYGFGGQRIAIPAGEVRGIRVRRIRDKDGKYPGSLTMVVGKTGQVLLLARAPWGPGLKDVCAELGLSVRTFTSNSVRSVAEFNQGVAGQRPHSTLRVRPRSWLAAGIVTVIMAIASGGLAAAVGVLLALLLPSSIGGIRDLIGIALCIAGLLGGLRLFLLTRAALLDSIRWLVTSARAGGPAPAHRVFEGLGESGKWPGMLVTVVLGIAIPLLFLWCLIIEADTIQHGFSDQALVSQLRQHGVTATGYVVNVPYYTTDSNDNQVEHDQATLEFTPAGGQQEVQVPDPAIAGWTWPMNTGAVVTIVYDPADPQTAAVQSQITGSPWHGAPTGNIIAGAVVIIAEPFLIWLFIRRVTAARRKATRDFIGNLA
jgi:hypothetical protein